MKLNTRAAFWAVALVSAASYIVCAAFVAMAPGATSQFFGWVMHVDLSSLGRHITWGSFFGGMICYSLVLGILAWASAWVYNRLAAGPER
ncbi:MAG TPA: DUF5676 family membrane protein [Thermoanaerobaculia bacterium]|jgi:FtsH-binding integral membrane protein